MADDAMDLLNNEPIARKKLTIFFIIDTSGSMSGDKIGRVNSVMEEVIPEIRGIGGSDSDIQVAVMTYDTDVKWMYDNCPIGTPVFIYDDENCPGPMGKPGTIYIDPDDTELRGWDPTDPDTQNPWEDKYRTGTAIRSDAAWVEYYNAVSLGTWDDSISPTDLQGWSTDYKTEGTRG